MQKTINILGATGSIGRQTVEVAKKFNLKVNSISVGKNYDEATRIIEELEPNFCAAADSECEKKLKEFCFGKKTKIITGEDSPSLAAEKDADICLNAISGFAGLHPTIEGIHHSERLALANKETLVAAGDFVKSEARAYGCTILPVDSEHSAIFQCLQDREPQEIKRLIITCSGGAFYGKNLEELETVTLADSLKHPTWNMGGKITVDCASLANKGLEVIEAMHLFDVPVEKIDVVIHRESIIHSMVEFKDNAILAQLGSHDMRLPIQYAITYPKREDSLCEQLDFIKIGKLTFATPDKDTFPCLRIAYEAAQKKGTAPCIFNASNEYAVHLFMSGAISFNSIPKIIEDTMYQMRNTIAKEISDIFECHKTAVKVASSVSEKYMIG